MASKSYGWDVRIIAKISPKMAKKQSFFDFLKNCPYDSNEIFYSHSTPYYGPLCAISLNSYGWDVRNIAKFSPKMAKKQSFFDFFDFLTNCSYDSNESESEGKRLKPTPLPHMRLWLSYQAEIEQSVPTLKKQPLKLFRSFLLLNSLLKASDASWFVFGSSGVGVVLGSPEKPVQEAGLVHNGRASECNSGSVHAVVWVAGLQLWLCLRRVGG